MNDFLNALTLLTIAHFPQRGPVVPARAFSYYPFIGFLIGLILSGAFVLLRLVFPSLVVGALVVVLWVCLTGGLHLDGFADACDGLFAAVSRERRLEILHDVHLGAFGGVGLILLLITKVAATASIPNLGPLLLAPIFGRWAMVYAVNFPLARQEGMAFMFHAGLTRREVLIATVLAAGAAVALGWSGVASLAGAFVVASLIVRLAITRLGGLTGDIYGMICESVEVTTLLIGAAMPR